MLEQLGLVIMWVGVSTLIGLGIFLRVLPQRKRRRSFFNPYSKEHKKSRTGFWPWVFVLVFTAPANVLLAVTATVFNRPPHEVAAQEWAPTEIGIATLAMISAAAAALACIYSGLHADRDASRGVFSRMLAAALFTSFCIGGAGLLFGPAVPNSGGPRTDPGTIAIYTSGSSTVRATVSFGSDVLNDFTGESVKLAADKPSGRITYSLTFVGAPDSQLEFAIESTKGAMAQEAEVTGDPVSFSVFESTGRDRFLPAGRCAAPGTFPPDIDEVGQVLRGTVRTDAYGNASARIVATGPYSWYETGGGRSVVTLPAISGGFYTKCAWGEGKFAGIWTAPDRFVLQTQIPALVDVDAEVAAKPVPNPAPNHPYELSWTMNEVPTSGVPEENGFGPGYAYISPRYSIQTAETTRLASAGLFMSALLAGAALTGAFEIVTTWPTPNSAPQPLCLRARSSGLPARKSNRLCPKVELPRNNRA